MAYLSEYQLLLGSLRREFPQGDRWRLASIVRNHPGTQARLDQIIRNYPGTPWEVLARREKRTALGLHWQPY